MKMSTQAKQLWELNEEQADMTTIYERSGGYNIVVNPGEKVDKYGEYDIKIRLTGYSNEEENTPSHPEVFRDLHQRAQSNGSGAERMYEIIDAVYRGDDPEKYTSELSSMKFTDGEFPADVTVYLIQLMMIEQEINYGPGGKWTRFSPPRDLFMSCIRWIFSGEYSHINDIINAGYNGQTPEKYQSDDDDIWSRPAW
jgi:hypothetical protein